ncbi:MAG: hypothetical protein ACRDTC_06745 [Pseudonocardiaceae bacterium]
MPDEGTALTAGLGIEVFATGSHEPAENEEYAPASSRHRAPREGWGAARVAQLGQDALTASARLVGEQVGMVVRETLAGMERAELAAATAAGLRTSSVQLSFGVKLTGGTGKVIEAVVTAGGEASVQVVVTLDRPS